MNYRIEVFENLLKFLDLYEYTDNNTKLAFNKSKPLNEKSITNPDDNNDAHVDAGDDDELDIGFGVVDKELGELGEKIVCAYLSVLDYKNERVSITKTKEKPGYDVEAETTEGLIKIEVKTTRKEKPILHFTVNEIRKAIYEYNNCVMLYLLIEEEAKRKYKLYIVDRFVEALDFNISNRALVEFSVIGIMKVAMLVIKISNNFFEAIKPIQLLWDDELEVITIIR